MTLGKGDIQTELRSGQQPWVAFALISGLFLGINLLTADRSPVPWQDEVMFIDPAVNYLSGKGFRSTAWLQREEETFSANSPLYSLLLVPWLSLTGVSPTGARSLNYLLVTAAAALMVAAARRFKLFSTTGAVALVTCLIFAGHSMAFSYRSGRYDMLGALLAAAAFYGFSLKSAPVRLGAIALIGFSMPWAGLQVVVFAAAMGLLVLVCFRRRFPLEILSLAGGVACGLGAMFVWLKVTGGFESFRRSVFALSAAGGAVQQRLTGTIEGLIGEPSSQILIAGLASLLVFFVVKKRTEAARIIAVTLFLGIMITVIVGFAGKAPIYYGWMRYLPLAVGVGTLFEHLQPRAHRWSRYALLATSAAAMTLFPARLYVVLLEWDSRDPAHLAEFASAHLRPDDIAYSSNIAYYAAKPRVHKLFVPSYRLMLSRQELDQISVLLLDRPNSRHQPFSASMQDWTLIATLETGGSVGRPPVQLDLYRRSDATAGTHVVPQPSITQQP